MPLKGLSFPTWVGWASGLLFVRPPWGSSVSSLSNRFLPSIMTIASLLVWLDFLIHAHVPDQSANTVRAIVSSGLIWGAVLLKFLLRVSTNLSLKMLTVFCTDLESHSAFLVNEFKLPAPIGRIDRILIVATFCLEVLASAASMAKIPSRRQYVSGSWLDFLADWPYALVFGLIGILPNFLLLYVTFAIVLVTTKYLFFVWNDFCLYVQDCVLNHSKICIGEKLNAESKSKVYFGVHEHELTQCQNLSSEEKWNHQIQQILRKFDCIVELFNRYDQLIGPLLSGMVSINIAVLLQRVNDAFTWVDSNSTLLWSDMASLASTSIQILTVVVHLGQEAKGNMVKRKLCLEKCLTTIDADPARKLQLKEIQELIKNWKWEMSGSQFFTVSRPLMATVIFLLASYTIIVFQIHMAEPAPAYMEEEPQSFL